LSDPLAPPTIVGTAGSGGPGPLPITLLPLAPLVTPLLSPLLTPLLTPPGPPLLAMEPGPPSVAVAGAATAMVALAAVTFDASTAFEDCCCAAAVTFDARTACWMFAWSWMEGSLAGS